MGERERTVRDDTRSETNLRPRGIGFAGLDEAFDGRLSLVREDKRRDCGEKRFDILVEHDGVVPNITFTPRSGKKRIISARLASRVERKLFGVHRQEDETPAG